MGKQFLHDYMVNHFTEITPKNFYSDMFSGNLEVRGQPVSGKYHALANELIKQEDGTYKSFRYAVYNDLDEIDSLSGSSNFVIISPITYNSLSRKSNCAREIYALAIDYDGIDKESHIIDFFHQVEIKFLPKPTYCVYSGNNLHLYFVLDIKLNCYKEIIEQLSRLRNALLKKIWNRYTTALYDKPQIESLFQGFRMPGTLAKDKITKVQVFRTGDKVSIDYLNSFVEAKNRAHIKNFNSNRIPLEEAKVLYPQWYEHRIVQGKRKGTWKCNSAVYDWWLEKLQFEASVGHRYFAIMCLAIYAKKCGIEYDKLEADALGLIPIMELMTVSDDNHFGAEDVMAALELYNDSYITFPIHSIVELTGIQIERNKRNYRKRNVHLAGCRAIKQAMKDNGIPVNEGRPSKKSEIIKWRNANPGMSISDCINATGLSRSVVYKYWKQDL